MPCSPPRSWHDLAGRSVGIFGAGVEGAATLAKLRSIGVEPVVVDDRPPADFGVPVLASSAGGLERLSSCEIVVKAPGISRYRADVGELERRGVEVVGGLGLWMEEADRSRVLLVTGTKGKSTTASILGQLLRGLGHPSFVGGNLGAVPFDPRPAQPGDGFEAATGGAGEASEAAAVTGNPQWWVIEASSYQVLDLWHAPRIVVLTSLGADHLDWHGDLERYASDKLSVVTLPGVEVVVANGTDTRLRARPELATGGPSLRWVGHEDVAAATWADALGLLGAHNRVNAALAARALAATGVDGARDRTALERAAAGFEPLPSRLERLGALEGVEFVDDSLATNVLATIAAIDAFEGRRLALLAGGYDRGIDYAPLAERLRRRDAPTLVLALPDNGVRIRAALERAPLPAGVSVTTCDDLAGAVPSAYSWCRPNGVVLLSPSAPSFGRFADWRDRSATFRRAVAGLGQRSARQEP